MRSRCTNPNFPSYASYGARGIQVCERWSEFAAFLADMGECPGTEMQIDRIDNAGHYEPANCKWSTRSEQCSNTRRNRFVEFNGERMTASQLARRVNMPPERLIGRLRMGYSVSEAVSESFGSRTHRTA